MVRVLTLVGAGVLLLLAYVGYPYLTIWQLDQAVNSQNESAINALVDWDSVGAGLSDDLNGLFDQPDPASDDPMDQVAANLLGIFSDYLVDPIVDFYTTPRGLTYLLNTQVILDDPGEALEDDFPSEDTWFDHISLAGLTGLTSFHVVVQYPADSGKARSDHGPMTLEFRLQGVKWRLTRVRLPLDGIAAASGPGEAPGNALDEAHDDLDHPKR
jgi:hypothetical protein